MDIKHVLECLNLHCVKDKEQVCTVPFTGLAIPGCPFNEVSSEDDEVQVPLDKVGPHLLPERLKLLNYEVKVQYKYRIRRYE